MNGGTSATLFFSTVERRGDLGNKKKRAGELQ